jgi:hypothetical protein
MSKPAAWFALIPILVFVAMNPPQTAAQSATCDQWLVPVTLVSNDGAFTTGLTSADLEPGPRSSESFKIVSLAADTRPRRIVILVDVSGSMAIPSSASWNLATEFLHGLAGVNLPNIRFALILFSDHVVEKIDFSQDPGAVGRRLRAIADDPTFLKKYVHGRTGIYDALQSGLQLLDNPTSADSLLVITDGGDVGSKTSVEQLLAELSPSATRVFSILFIRRIIERNDPREDARVVKEFIDFVPRSGGDIFGPILVNRSGNYAMVNPQRTSKPFGEELSEFYKEMFNNDVLSLRTGASLSKPIRLELRPSSQSHEKWKDATLFFPHQLGPCSTGNPL